MKNNKPIPLAYMITCRTYATWLHGDKRESVDRNHNIFCTPRIEHNPILERKRKNLLCAIQYTVEEQGAEMALYCEPGYCEVIRH